jgi:hypothetical protein
MRELYDFISSLPPKTYTLVAVLLGMLLIDDLTPAEQRSLGGLFVLIGEVIWVNSSQEELLIERQRKGQMTAMQRDIENLKKRSGMY